MKGGFFLALSTSLEIESSHEVDKYYELAVVNVTFGKGGYFQFAIVYGWVERDTCRVKQFAVIKNNPIRDNAPVRALP